MFVNYPVFRRKDKKNAQTNKSTNSDGLPAMDHDPHERTATDNFSATADGEVMYEIIEILNYYQNGQQFLRSQKLMLAGSCMNLTTTSLSVRLIVK